VAEGARLESVFTGNRNVGSNPTPSANICSQMFAGVRTAPPWFIEIKHQTTNLGVGGSNPSGRAIYSWKFNNRVRPLRSFP
jgi:hypothetical protein